GGLRCSPLGELSAKLPEGVRSDGQRLLAVCGHERFHDRRAERLLRSASAPSVSAHERRSTSPGPRVPRWGRNAAYLCSSCAFSPAVLIAVPAFSSASPV